MDIADIIVIMLCTYYTNYILKMIFNKKQRVGTQQANIKLDDLRTKPKKTLAEQKEFLNIKYPKRIGKFKWSWKIIPKTILTIVIYILIFRFYFFVFAYFGLKFQLWQAILIVMTLPMLLNLVLEKFKIQKGDLSVFFRGGRKK